MAEDVFERVREAITITFGVPAEEVTAETKQADLDGWDSVGHLNLMLMIEDTFGVQLDVPDMEKLTSVPALVEFLGS